MKNMAFFVYIWPYFSAFSVFRPFMSLTFRIEPQEVALRGLPPFGLLSFSEILTFILFIFGHIFRLFEFFDSFFRWPFKFWPSVSSSQKLPLVATRFRPFQFFDTSCLWPFKLRPSVLSC